MNEVWIANASPIIVLAKIEMLDLLLDEGRSLIIPKAVADEVLRSPAQDLARRALQTGWGKTQAEAMQDPEVLEWGLGAGETEVLSLARQKKATAVIDDRAARNACKALSIQVIGTLGVVLHARIQGRIDSTVKILKALQGAGLYLDEDLIRTALQKTTGETWPE